MDVNVCCIFTSVHINMVDEIILGIGQDEKIHSIFVSFIIVGHPYRRLPDSHYNSSLIKITMLPKNLKNLNIWIK